MTQTETKTITTKTKAPTVTLAELKTVKWISSIGLVKDAYDYSSTKYTSAKRRFPILLAIFATIEMFFLQIYLFIHSLPWPDFVMNILLAFDRIIESILEFIGDKLEWWWDIFVIRLMWLRDSIEMIFDTVLSICLFVVIKITEFWMWIASLYLTVVKMILSPWIWLMKTLFPPVEKKPPTSSSTSVTDSSLSSGTPIPSINESEDLGRLSGTTSECESDVSVVSENWSVGHTDKHGKSYNRLEMKATAEGKLRAAMYKRVKSQLTLMRKNSINFSRDMTSYARHILSPKISPVISFIRKWINNLESKRKLEELITKVSKWVDDHYLASLTVSLLIAITSIPINVVQNISSGTKKKSKRTRSMRSESLRRRTGANAVIVSQHALESYGLNQSKEPVVMEEPEFCHLQRMESESPKSEEDGSRDSALASSIDDLYHMSDGNDGGNDLKSQTIHEEDAREKKNEINANENGNENEKQKVEETCVNGQISENDNQNCMVVENNITEEKTDTFSEEPRKSNKSTLNKDAQPQNDSVNNSNKSVKDRNVKEERCKRSPKASDKKTKTFTPAKQSSIPHKSGNEDTKRDENHNANGSNEKLNKSKSPKRKISFSLM